MKARIYLRIAKSKKGVIVKAGTKPSYAPLPENTYNNAFNPTVAIALDLDIPDSEFEASRILLNAKIEKTTPAVEIKQIEEDTK